jgi:hypothetical protein
MPAYQIYRLKEIPRQQFRWAPHTPGVTVVKLKDYEPGPAIQAASPYALWLDLRGSDQAIAVGDLIEVVGDATGQQRGQLRIFKYIGFEEAQWYVPDPVPPATAEPVEVR